MFRSDITINTINSPSVELPYLILSFIFGLSQIKYSQVLCSALYYNRVTIVATIVTQISRIILILFKLLNVMTNDLAYLGYDRSYNRNTVIVQATGHKWVANLSPEVLSAG